MSDCRFGVSPVNYPNSDPDIMCKNRNRSALVNELLSNISRFVGQSGLPLHFEIGGTFALFQCFCAPNV